MAIFEIAKNGIWLKKIREIKKLNFTNNFLGQIPFSCNFKNGQNSFFELGKCFKTAKNAISRKKKILIYLILRGLLPRLF